MVCEENSNVPLYIFGSFFVFCFDCSVKEFTKNLEFCSSKHALVMCSHRLTQCPNKFVPASSDFHPHLLAHKFRLFYQTACEPCSLIPVLSTSST